MVENKNYQEIQTFDQSFKKVNCYFRIERKLRKYTVYENDLE